MRTTAALLALALLAVTGCGDDDEGGGTTDPDQDPAPTVPEGAVPGGGDGPLFVEIASVGGFAPASFAARNLPTAVVYGDGLAFTPGVITLQYPGPAVLPVATGRLDDAALDELLAAAAEAGLLAGEPDVGDASDIPVADATSTRVTVVVDGEARVVEAYALEIGDVGPTNLTPAQVEARARLAQFVATVTRVVSTAATDTYDPDRYRVVAGEPGHAPDVPPNELAWPAELPEPVQGECVAITGDGATTLEALLRDATEITEWTLGDRRFTLAVRPVLPHEPDCPEGGG